MPRLPLNTLCSPGQLWTSWSSCHSSLRIGSTGLCLVWFPQVGLFGIFDSPTVVLRLWQLDLYEIFLLLSSFKGFKKKWQAAGDVVDSEPFRVGMEWANRMSPYSESPKEAQYRPWMKTSWQATHLQQLRFTLTLSEEAQFNCIRYQSHST